MTVCSQTNSWKITSEAHQTFSLARQIKQRGGLQNAAIAQRRKGTVVLKGAKYILNYSFKWTYGPQVLKLTTGQL